MKIPYLLHAIIFCVLSVSFTSEPETKIQGVPLYYDCMTPDNRTGVCVNIRDCQSAVDLLLRRSLTQVVKKYLQQSRCDAGPNITICCANFTLPGNMIFDAEACAAPVSNRIFGGTVAQIGEFPWMALISYKKPFDQYGFHCAGSLINTRYILTAAHCVNKMPVEWIIESVRLGEYNIETNNDCMQTNQNETICAPKPQDLAIDQIIVHPKYNSSSRSQYHDIALLRTAEPVHFNSYIRPACLPIDDLWRHNPLTNLTVEVAGWGQTEEFAYSSDKLKADMTVWDITECEDKFQVLDINIKGTYQMCAGGVVGVDACRGDSGGPLIVTAQANKRGYYFLAGIVSFGVSQCGLNGWPGVYTRVGQYVDWIQQNMIA